MTHVEGGLNGGPPDVLCIEDLAPLGSWTGGEFAFDGCGEFDHVGHASFDGGEARVGRPFGTVERTHDVGPVAFAFEAQQPQPFAVTAAVPVDERIGRALTVGGRNVDVQAGGDVVVPPEHVGTQAHQRSEDQLSCAGPFSLERRGRDAARHRHARHVVAHAAALVGQVLALGRQRVGDRGPTPEGPDVVGVSVPVGAVEPVAGDHAVDEARETFVQRRVVESGSFESAGSVVGDEDIGVGQQAAHDVAAGVGRVSGRRRSRLPRLSSSNGGLMLPGKTHSSERNGSPVSGSTLMTSAPQSARMAEQDGPATQSPSSTGRERRRAARSRGLIPSSSSTGMRWRRSSLPVDVRGSWSVRWMASGRLNEARCSWQ